MLQSPGHLATERPLLSMLITSEHKKISQYVWLYGYVVSGLLSGFGFYLYLGKKMNFLGIILILALAIWIAYVLFLIFKETTTNPKNIEILYSEKKTPKIIYTFWAMFQFVVMSFLGGFTCIMFLSFIR